MDLLTEGNVTIATALSSSALYFRGAETICILEGKHLEGEIQRNEQCHQSKYGVMRSEYSLLRQMQLKVQL